MRYVKLVTILFLIFIGIAVNAQAKGGFVPTYEQTAQDMYAVYYESITQNLSDFEKTSTEMKQKTLAQIEADIADEFGASRKQVQIMIADYKQQYVTAIETETDQLKNNVLEAYANEKKNAIQSGIKRDIETFLEAELSE